MAAQINTATRSAWLRAALYRCRSPAPKRRPGAAEAGLSPAQEPHQHIGLAPPRARDLPARRADRTLHSRARLARDVCVPAARLEVPQEDVARRAVGVHAVAGGA